MRASIENQQLTIEVDSHGAELKSVKRGDREYMWQADPAYWNRTSPVLFPFVGAVADGAYRFEGRTYPMGQHGFARDCEFVLAEKDEKSLTYRLASSEETRKKFPMDFELTIRYILSGEELTVEWQVRNPMDRTLYYAIGAHPAFCVPVAADGTLKGVLLGLGDRPASYTVRDFKDPLAANSTHTLTTDDQGFFALDGHTFDGGALIFEEGQLNRACLAGADARPFVTVDFTSPLVGIWSPSGKNAPFVCIEPWYGRADAEGFSGDLTERDYEQTLAPGETAVFSYRMTFHA